MGFLDYWRSSRARLDTELARQIPDFFRGLPPSHLKPVRRVLADGKRLRGCLVCLISDALGGSAQAAVARAIAIECIQAASLIHDDVVDGDALRRDRAATWVAVGRRRAVLLGDLIFATALQRMVELSQEDGRATAEVIATMAAGAYQEPLAHRGCGPAPLAAEADLYPRLIHLKTGALFAAAARLGSLAAGAAPAVARQAFEFGARVGEAYQIADDLRDLIELDSASEADLRAQLPLLAPLLAHFCADTISRDDMLCGTGDIGPRLAALRPLLRQRMGAAMQARLSQAAALVHGFPDNGYTALLQAAPAQITRLMLDG